MAPLGILTAITAAIRVRGPSWMKAVIGRARENLATVELELMSSTSHEVCELWNGQGIIRTMGAPEVQEIIYLEDYKDYEDREDRGNREDPKTYGLFTVEKAKRILYEQRTYPAINGEKLQDCELIYQCNAATHDPFFLGKGPNSKHDPERKQEIHPRLASKKNDRQEDDQPERAPNITLNLHPRSSNLALFCVALFGIFLQVGALVFTGFSVYHPTFSKRFTKDGQPVGEYAYPLMAVGTGLLSLGLLLCTYAVDGGTKETEFVPGYALQNSRREVSEEQASNDKNDLKARILWLQRKHTVSDQVFSASVIFRPPRGKHETLNCILASRRDDDEKHFLVVTSIGVGCTLCGFAGQFQGLRGLHWSASIVQLVCIAIMTALRAIVRRHLVVVPIPRPVPDKHEMDWLALWLAKRIDKKSSHSDEKSSQWPRDIKEVKRETDEMKDWLKYGQSRNMAERQEQKPVAGRATKERVGDLDEPVERLVWEICTSPKQSSEELNQPSPKQSSEKLNLPANVAFNIRKRLGQLTQWRGDAAEASIALAKSMSAVLETLMLSGKERTGSVQSETPPTSEKVFTWSLPVQLNGSSIQKIQLQATKKGTDPWTVDATEIDALLSLWLFHIHEVRNAFIKRKDDGANKTYNGDWLQQDVQQIEVIRLLGPSAADFRRNVGFWVGSDNAHGLDVKTRDEIIARDKLIDTRQDQGFSGSIGFHSDWDEKNTTHGSTGFLVVTTSNRLDLLLAQHLFLSFMTEVCQKTRDTGICAETADLSNPSAIGSTTNPEMSLSVLTRSENKKLTQLARKIQESGLCTVEDARLCIVPALCYTGKLQSWDKVMGVLMERSRPAELLGHWDQVVPAYTKLLQDSSSWGLTHSLFLHVTALILAKLHFVVDNLTLLNSQETSDDVQSGALLRARTALERALEEQFPRPQSKILSDFALLYRSLQRFSPEVWFRFNITNELLDNIELDNIKNGDKLVYLRDGLDLPHAFHHLKSTSVDKLNPRIPNGQTNVAGHSATDVQGWTLLYYAIRMGGFAALKEFHNADGELGDDKVNKYLIKAAEDRTRASDGRYMLHYVAMAGNNSLYELLPQDKADIEAEDCFRQRPIHLAAFYGSSEILAGLLKEAKVGARDRWGRTALHLAALSGECNVIKQLHDKSTDLIKIEDHDGRIPLFLAVLRGHFLAFEKLLEFHLEAGDDVVNEKDFRGRTLLHIAAWRGHVSVVDKLLELSDSWIEAEDNYRRTPLHLAALGGHDRVTKELIRRCPQVTHARDQDGRTALELAKSEKYFKVVEALVRQRRKVFTPGHKPGTEG